MSLPTAALAPNAAPSAGRTRSTCAPESSSIHPAMPQSEAAKPAQWRAVVNSAFPDFAALSSGRPEAGPVPSSELRAQRAYRPIGIGMVG